MAIPTVTAGFRCASGLPHAIAVNTPVITAKAHPAVIAIQPAPSALLRFSSMLATLAVAHQNEDHRPHELA